jgi:capsular polysaccharide biosynthesis protein
MELAEILKIIASRKLVTLAIVTLAIAAAVGVKLATRSAPKGAATVQILVDSPNSALANLVQNTVPLTARASVFAQVMASQAVIEEIGKSAAIPANLITAEGPYSGTGQKLDVVTPSEARGNQLLAQNVPYKLTFLAQENEPVITASVQAPNITSAARLANGVYPGITAYVASLQKTMNTPSAQRVTIRELGPPQAGTVNTSAGMTVAVAAAFGVLLLGGLLLIGFEGARRKALASEALLERSRAVELNDAVLAENFESVAAAGERGGARGVAVARTANGNGHGNGNGNGNGHPQTGAPVSAQSANATQRDPDRPVPLPVGERD